MTSLTLILDDESATARLARALAGRLGVGDFVGLRGELGAGKTAFARAVIRTLSPQGQREEVPSPTFTLVQIYDTARPPVGHFDLYRIEAPGEVLELGLDDALQAGCVLVEWPQLLGSLLPPDRLDLTFDYDAGTPARRHVRLEGFGSWAERLAGFGREWGEADHG